MISFIAGLALCALTAIAIVYQNKKQRIRLNQFCDQVAILYSKVPGFADGYGSASILNLELSKRVQGSSRDAFGFYPDHTTVGIRHAYGGRLAMAMTANPKSPFIVLADGVPDAVAQRFSPDYLRAVPNIAAAVIENNLKAEGLRLERQANTIEASVSRQPAA